MKKTSIVLTLLVFFSFSASANNWTFHPEPLDCVESSEVENATGLEQFPDRDQCERFQANCLSLVTTRIACPEAGLWEKLSFSFGHIFETPPLSLLF